jgi:hypothetical protein
MACTMRYADLSLSVQIASTAALAMVLSAFLTRVVIFFRRASAWQHPHHPNAWTVAQCKAFGYFRVLLDLSLVPLWGLLCFTLPLAPTNWPFGLLALISMLLISHAWVALLIPRGWKNHDAFARSFWLTLAFLVAWWGTMFTATWWILAKASSPTPYHIMPGHYYADIDRGRRPAVRRRHDLLVAIAPVAEL